MPLSFQSKPVAPDKDERLRKWLADPAFQDLRNHLEALAIECEVLGIEHAAQGNEGHDKLCKNEMRKSIEIRKAMRLLLECQNRKHDEPFLSCAVAVKL